MTSGRWVDLDEDLLRELWADELQTLPGMASALGCSEGTVRNRAATLGLPPRKRGAKPVDQGPVALPAGEWVTVGGVRRFRPRDTPTPRSRVRTSGATAVL